MTASGKALVKMYAVLGVYLALVVANTVWISSVFLKDGDMLPTTFSSLLLVALCFLGVRLVDRFDRQRR